MQGNPPDKWWMDPCAGQLHALRGEVLRQITGQMPAELQLLDMLVQVDTRCRPSEVLTFRIMKRFDCM